MKRNHLSILIGIVLILVLSSISVFAEPTGILKGKVLDVDTGEPIEGAKVEIEKLKIAYLTDGDGFYTIAGIRIGFYDVKVSHSNYISKVEEGVGVAANIITPLSFKLKEGDPEVHKIVVEDKRLTSIVIDKLKTVTDRPVTEKEVDVMPVTSFFGVIETLPGVIRHDGQLHIRGGRDDQINYMVDGVSITDPVTGTFGGTLNQNAIASMNLMASGFSAEYGKAISGIITVVTKEGDINYEGEFRLLMSEFLPTAFDQGRKDIQLSLGGPLYVAKDEDGSPSFPRYTFFVSGQKTIGDYYYLNQEQYNSENDYSSDFDFRDFNDFSGKLALYFSRHKKLRIGYQFSYATIDIVTDWTDKDTEQPTQYQDNNQVSLEWHHTIASNLFYDIYLNRFENGIKLTVYDKRPVDYTKEDYPVYEDRTSVVYTAKFDITNILNEVHMLKTGMAYSMYDLEEYFHMYPKSADQLDEYHHYLDDETFYILDLMDWEEDFTVNFGIRYDRREYAGSQVSPRLSVGFAITDRTKFMFDYGQFYQPPAAEWVLKGKMDYWMDSGNRFLSAENAIQYSYGIVHLFNDHMKMTLTAYYKSISDLIQFVQGGTGFSRSEMYSRPENVDHGYSEGIEFTLERPFYRNFFYRFNYTYAVARGTGGKVNIGSPIGAAPQAEFFLDYDIRHSLSLNVIYEDQGGGFSALWRYQTGYPYTPEKSEKNSGRQPDYKKVDISMWKTLQKLEYLGGRWDLYVTIYNLFDIHNISYHEKDIKAQEWGSPRNGLAGIRVRWM
ncbi:TonB-dependent receptor [Candidatus Dependentiae bacterium]|nr:TonB-dependent receptor [Candidatus Dependentiae bacterium]